MVERKVLVVAEADEWNLEMTGEMAAAMEFEEEATAASVVVASTRKEREPIAVEHDDAVDEARTPGEVAAVFVEVENYYCASIEP